MYIIKNDLFCIFSDTVYLLSYIKALCYYKTIEHTKSHLVDIYLLATNVRDKFTLIIMRHCENIFFLPWQLCVAVFRISLDFNIPARRRSTLKRLR